VPSLLRVLQGQAIALPPVAAMLTYALCRAFPRHDGDADRKA
jgi:hypothetical protein